MRMAISWPKPNGSPDEEQLITADIDLERLEQDRMRLTSFNDSATDCRERVQAIRRVPFEFACPKAKSHC